MAKTLPKLGIINVIRVAAYRLMLRFSMHKTCFIRMNMKKGPFFYSPVPITNLAASKQWKDEALYFDHINVPFYYKERPSWFYNPTTRRLISKSVDDWWRIPDFAADRSDIKNIWDISRFSWALPLAERAACGDAGSLDRLNSWIDSWVEENPSYQGYNWKCGQEASIRIMHLAAVALIFRQKGDPLPALVSLVRAHVARICSTTSYAIAQDNNHGICEAVGMFVGGAWLSRDDPLGKAGIRNGRQQLEERVRRLISEDGGFSMYSVTYHREFMDALCIAEAWRRFLSLPKFSGLFYERVAKATVWLAACVQPRTGDAPNIGTNDGTRLLPFTDSDYRDFRPSVQLAAALFCEARAYRDSGEWDLPLHWLGIPMPACVLPPSSSHLSEDTGFCFLTDREQDVSVVIRYPVYKFRPGHADPLHLDMWIDGRNILRGPGSYRYHSDDGSQEYFTGVSAHNTVQFDGLEAMPRLGRFLFGDWLHLEEGPRLNELPDRTVFFASYRHPSGAVHKRNVALCRGRMLVSDMVSGFKDSAVLRWRLLPGEWVVTADGVQLDNLRVRVSSKEGGLKIVLTSGWESRYYGSKSVVPILEATVSNNSCIETIVEWR